MSSVRVLASGLLLFALLLSGCGSKQSYSTMSADDQARLKTSLEQFALAYKTRTIENNESPSGWADMDRFLQDSEMEADFGPIKNAGCTIHWNLSVAEVTGAGSGETVLAESGEGGPKAYADGTVK